MCRRFTGPHSVLQIFLEKIIECVDQISSEIKESAIKDQNLWIEEKVIVRVPKTNNIFNN